MNTASTACLFIWASEMKSSLSILNQTSLWPESVMGISEFLHMGQKFEKFSLIPGPSLMNTLRFCPSFELPVDRKCFQPLCTAFQGDSLTCEDAASSRSIVGIRQLASPRKHIRMWSTSAQRPTVSISTVKPPRRTPTVFRMAWLPGRRCWSSAQPWHQREKTYLWKHHTQLVSNEHGSQISSFTCFPPCMYTTSNV